MDDSNRKGILVSTVLNKKKYLIKIKTICFIKSETPYLKIHTLGKKTFLYKSTLIEFLRQLTDSDFIQIHKTTVVNINYVEYFISRDNGDYDLYLENDEKIRMSRTYFEKFKERLHF